MSRLIPAMVVDALPVDWWHPGNLHLIASHALHFCVEDDVRSIEWDGRTVALGRRHFPSGRGDVPDST